MMGVCPAHLRPDALSYTASVRIPRTLIVSLALAVSPIGDAVCEVVCSAPVLAQGAADEVSATETAGHQHHAATSPSAVPPVSSAPMLASRAEACGPTTPRIARVALGAVASPRALPVGGVVDASNAAGLQSRARATMAAAGPPPIPLHQSSVPLRI